MKLITQGKTKRIYEHDDPNYVILEAIDRLTAGDAAKVAEIDSIGAEKTRQCANNFRALEREGVATAFVEQTSPIALKCHAVEMLPLEFVMRRFAYGSYLKRNLHKEPGYRFAEVECEIFHKDCFVTPPTSEEVLRMSENAARDRYLTEQGWPDGIYTDPYVKPEGDEWFIYNPKEPIKGEPITKIKAELSMPDLLKIWRELLIPAFLTLEKKLGSVDDENAPIVLVDMKFEVGKRKDNGGFVIADVIDNDSWRIWPKGDPKAQLDKQGFREGDALDKVMKNYKIVTEITNKF